MLQYDPKLSQIVVPNCLTGFNRSQLVPTGLNWSQLVSNILKGLKMFQMFLNGLNAHCGTHFILLRFMRVGVSNSFKEMQ